MKDILFLFPTTYRNLFTELSRSVHKLTYIRLRANQPIVAGISGKEYFLTKEGKFTKDCKAGHCMNRGQIEEILNHICQYSPYAYLEELKKGYITVEGGHRIGVAGQIVTEDNQIKAVKNIAFLNIRISHEILGAANAVLPYIYRNGEILNTLIVSPPGIGKTTLLRDLVRQASDGNPFGEGRTVGVVDERSELAGCYMGVPQNHLGIRTDVLDCCPKTYGMMMLIRSMAPRIVAIDELGTLEDAKALQQVIHCGSNILVTVHGNSYKEVSQKPFLKEILQGKYFQRIVILRKKDGQEPAFSVVDGEGEPC